MPNNTVSQKKRKLDASSIRCMDGWSSVLHPRQHSIGYMGDGFCRSKDPTNSIKVLKEHIQYTNNRKNTLMRTIKHKAQQVP